VSEKSITRQQAGLVRCARTSRRDSSDLAGVCSAAKFVVEGAQEEYDAPEIEPNRKSRPKGCRNMRGTFPRLVLSGVAVITLAPCIRAQIEKWKIDADHSHATFLLISSRAPNEPWVGGIARANGPAALNSEDLSKIALRMSIYPEGEGEPLLIVDDTLRPDALASLAICSVLSFQSERSVARQKYQLELSGDLTMTHVIRASTTAWSNSYSGSRYVDPVKKNSKLRSVSDACYLERIDRFRRKSGAPKTRLRFGHKPGRFSRAVDQSAGFHLARGGRRQELHDAGSPGRFTGLAGIDLHWGTVVGPAIVRADFTSPLEGKPEAASHPQPVGDKIRILFSS